MIGNELINSILYFLAFIPIIMVPMFILQLAPFFVIKGISTLLKADSEENSAEKFFGIEPEEYEEDTDYNDRETYLVNKRSKSEEFSNVKYYVVFKILGIGLVSVLLGYILTNKLVNVNILKNFGISKLSFLFVFSAMSYVAVMLSLFDQFKDNRFNKIIFSIFFFLDGVINAINCSIIILIFRF